MAGSRDSFSRQIFPLLDTKGFWRARVGLWATGWQAKGAEPRVGGASLNGPISVSHAQSRDCYARLCVTVIGRCAIPLRYLSAVGLNCGNGLYATLHDINPSALC